LDREAGHRKLGEAINNYKKHCLKEMIRKIACPHISVIIQVGSFAVCKHIGV
jgi:hypothetical protein